MRRRGKRGANDSESTGKIGQEIPANQPTPLQPMYPEDKRRKAEQDGAVDQDKKPARAPEPSVVNPPVSSPAAMKEEEAVPPGDTMVPEVPVASATPPEGKLVVETQPESPSVPPPELPSASPKDLKGYVVLAIGLPGAGRLSAVSFVTTTG